MSNIIIVGSGFKDFADKKGIWIVNDYIKETVAHSSVVLGQGLTCENFDAIQAKINKDKFNLSQVSKELTHQHNNRNVLIFNFKNIGEMTSEALIYVRGENDLLQDHITGIHISGIILVESARQFLITSLMNDGYVDDRFVLNSISTHFLSYVFPTEICMKLSYKFLKNTKNEKQVIAKLQALQNKKVCAEFEISSTLIPNKLAAMSELLAANQFKRLLNG